MSSSLRALIVEDSEGDARLLVETIRRGGYDVSFRQVYSATSFVKALQDQPWDVVLADHMMPRFRGLSALKILQEKKLDIPFILVSGKMGEDLAVEAFKAGAHDYVLKENMHRVVPAIKQCLAEAALRKERQSLYEALSVSEQRYRQLVELSPEGIFIQCEGKIVFANSALVSILGASRPEDVLSKPALEFVHPAYRGMVKDRIRRLETSSEIQPTLEEKFVRLDGKTVDVEVTARGVAYCGRPAVQGFVRDITERKKLEEKLRESQKMEAVGRLAGGVAHDFNNLLTVILGYSDLISEQTLQGNAPDSLSELRRASMKAAALTSQLLAFSRKQVLQPVILNLNTVVRDMDRLLRRVIGEDITLVVSLDDGLSSVKADASQMEQMIVNLAMNARDAMPKGGRLSIKSANVEVLETEGADIVPGPYVMISVSDTGAGLDEDTQKHFFEPFYPSADSAHETRLGLAAVYGIVKQAGGTMTLQSALGQGSTFQIYLPWANEKDFQQNKLHVSAVENTEGSETILVVEDDNLVRVLTVDILRSKGYRVLEASHGGDALKLAEGCAGGIDLLLTDVVMPGLGGMELAQKLRERRPGMKVLYMSGYSARAGGGGTLPPDVSFLQKPFRPQSLLRMVRSALDPVADGTHKPKL